MCIEQLGILAGLALVDSTSFGTLVFPLLLVVAARRVVWPAMAVYLGTVLNFYFAIRLLLVLGLDAVLDRLQGGMDSRGAAISQPILGAGLFAASWPLERRAKASGGRGDRLRGIAQRPSAMIPLALTATLVEAATMVPYLAAIGIITTSETSLVGDTLVLLAYCLVMILPAMLLLAGASLFGERIWAALGRFSSWLDRQTASAIGWIVGAVGVLLALDALGRLTGNQ
ncbi:MAG TPA: GAP family protein [Thermomicrobiales bacterium]|jgi:cytochrome c biogenesis protein CcdA|nr:GAP family protein [Thermomicrobiales bacterium]